MERTRFARSTFFGFSGVCVFLAVGAGLITIVIGVTILPLAIYGERAEGTVLQSHEEYLPYADGSELRRWATVQFRAGSRAVEVRKNWGLTLHQGGRIPIRYIANYPEDARVDRFWHLYGPVIGFAATSCVLSILGPVFHRVSRRAAAES